MTRDFFIARPCSLPVLTPGQVLIAGGDEGSTGGSPTAELFNPSDGTFSCVGGLSSSTFQCNASMTSARFGHTATLLTAGAESGEILIAGGLNSLSTPSAVLNTAELFNPASNTFACVGGVSSSPPLCNQSLNTARYGHYGLVLTTGPSAGHVLIAWRIGSERGTDRVGRALRSHRRNVHVYRRNHLGSVQLGDERWTGGCQHNDA